MVFGEVECDARRHRRCEVFLLVLFTVAVQIDVQSFVGDIVAVHALRVVVVADDWRPLVLVQVLQLHHESRHLAVVVRVSEAPPGVGPGPVPIRFGNHPPYGLNVWTVNRYPNHMITKPRVLQQEFVPGDVKHRDAQINTLSATLEPVTDGNRATHSILHGPAGSGKTCIARYTVDQLRKNTAEMHSHHVDCWVRRTRSAVLYDMLDGVNRATTVHRKSTPPDELRDHLEDTIDMPYVVVLDEVDQLEDTDVIHDLYETSGLTMLLVTDRVEEVFADMDTRLNSRLTSSNRIPFDRYSLDELVAILRDRARLGLANDAVGQAELEHIADEAAGDARRAIGILRNAAQDAKDDGRETLSDDLIEDAVPSATRDTQETLVNKLPHGQQVLYDIITEQSSIRAGELYDRYCEEVPDPKTKRTIRNWLNKFVRYDMIKCTGNTKDRRYHPVS